MYRIAGLFLLQRLKGSMSGDARNFNNNEKEAIIKNFFPPLQSKAPKEIHAILIEILGEHAPSYATVKNWVAQFKRGDFSTCDGRSKTVTTPEIIDQIHEPILEDRRISSKSIAEQLDISRERVGSIIHEDLDMRKLSAKWVPKCLNADQKRQRCQSSGQHLEFFLRDSNYFIRARLVSMDETWLYHYDSETKQQSMAWRHSGSPRLKKIPSAKIRWKRSRLDLLGSRRHPPHLLSSKWPNYQRGVLLISVGAIEGLLKEKHRGNFTKGDLFLQDNAPAHRTLAHQKKLAYGGFQCLDYPPYSLDLAPSDYHLSLDWKINWKVAIFHSTRRSLLPRRPGWTNNFLNYFWVAFKS